MRCVTILTLLYFGVFLVFLLSRIIKDPWTQRRVTAFSEMSKQGMAFVPMLCVMMIGLRLRAVMLNRHDPQIWAQYTMLVATLAIIMQVLIAIPVVFLSPSDDDDD